MHKIADEHEPGRQPGHTLMAAKYGLEDDSRGNGTERSCQQGMPNAAMDSQAMENRMQAITDPHKGAEPQYPKLSNRVVECEAEQDGKREEDAKASEHGLTWPRFLEVNIGQHRAQNAGHGYGDQVFRRHNVGSQGQCCEGAGDNGANCDMCGEIGHVRKPPIAGLYSRHKQN